MEFMQGRSKWLMFLGGFLLLFGIILLSTWSITFNSILDIASTLTPNHPATEIWRKNPMPLYLDFYFFNWTNPEDINNASIKPRFEEIGPFRYRETKEKVNLTWYKNDTVGYHQLRWWYFDQENSPHHIDEQIVTINAVALSAAHLVNKWSYLTKAGFSYSLKTLISHLYIKRSVRELLFEGFDDPLINLGKTLPFLSDYMPPFDKFGWFYTRNGSYTFDGHFNMARGVNGDLGVLKNWNYQNRTKYFDDSCGQVHGSAGELFQRHQKRDSIGFFSPDICRHVSLDYEEEEYISTILGYKYSGQAGMLDNGTLIPENKCYCSGECVPSGLMNASSCRYGTPSFVSLPHFYNADPFYLNLVDGLHPQKEKHEMYITLEPKTGVPLKVAARLQLNLMIYPMPQITLFSKVPKAYFPILWFEQTAQIPTYIVVLLKLSLFIPHIIICISMIMILLGSILVYHAFCRYPLLPYRRQHKRKFQKQNVPLTHASYTPIIEIVKK